MVFTTCTELYLESEYGEGCIRDAPAKLVYLTLHGERRKPEEEVVVLSQVLASKATLGYESLCNIRVNLDSAHCMLEFLMKPVTEEGLPRRDEHGTLVILFFACHLWHEVLSSCMQVYRTVAKGV